MNSSSSPPAGGGAGGAGGGGVSGAPPWSNCSSTRRRSGDSAASRLARSLTSRLSLRAEQGGDLFVRERLDESDHPFQPRGLFFLPLHVDFLRQPGHGRRLEDRLHRDLDVEAVAQPRDQL